MSISINLTKGANISLVKQDPTIKKALVGLQWDPRTTDGAEFDLDASAFLVDASGKVRKVSDFVFYNNPKNANGSVVYGGDNRTGAGDGDDETILVDLEKVPADIAKIVFAVTIYESEARRQNFGQVPSSLIRICNKDTIDAHIRTYGDEHGDIIDPEKDPVKLKIGEIARFDLQENYSTETAMVFAELYRHSDGTTSEWKFRAIGAGYSGGLQALVNNYVDPNAA